MKQAGSISLTKTKCQSIEALPIVEDLASTDDRVAIGSSDGNREQKTGEATERGCGIGTLNSSGVVGGDVDQFSVIRDGFIKLASGHQEAIS